MIKRFGKVCTFVNSLSFSCASPMGPAVTKCMLYLLDLATEVNALNSAASNPRGVDSFAV